MRSQHSGSSVWWGTHPDGQGDSCPAVSWGEQSADGRADREQVVWTWGAGRPGPGGAEAQVRWQEACLGKCKLSEIGRAQGTGKLVETVWRR